MENAQQHSFLAWSKIYFQLTKPSIIAGNLVTAVGGFAMATHHHFHFFQLLLTLIGIAFVVGSGCVFNNYIDRKADQKMTRTKNRPLARGVISAARSMVFATVLGLAGIFTLAFYVNVLTALIALIGFVVYALWYSIVKHQTVHATLIGSIAGAVPAMAGYVGESGKLDAGSFIIFAIVMLWQMPHFYAIAIYREREYEKASIPVMPLVWGLKTTKINMLVFTILFIGATTLPTIYGYAGNLYLVGALLLGCAWLITCIRGFYIKHEKIWARKVFLVSLLVIMGLCTLLCF